MFSIKKTFYIHDFQDSENKGFHAQITMNARDSMVFAEVLSLPSEESEKNRYISEFFQNLIQDYGGKISVCVSLQMEITLFFKPVSDAIYFIPSDALQKTLEFFKGQSKVKQLEGQSFTLVDKTDLISQSKALSQFKIEHAPFVTEQKIRQGVYSEEAEKQKLLNPHVMHFALQKGGRIIACIMGYKHGNKVYVSDFIVHADHRHQGVAKFLLIMISKKIEIDKSGGVWFIAGGDGQSAPGKHLIDLFEARSITEIESQRNMALFLGFYPPQKELLIASNRDKKTGNAQDPSSVTEEALNFFRLRSKSTITFFQEVKDAIVPTSTATSSEIKCSHQIKR